MDSPQRPRRLRRTPALRRLARETRLDPANLIAPLFVELGTGVRTPLPSLPGQFRWSPDTVAARGGSASRGSASAGSSCSAIPARKDATGSSGWDPKGPVPRALGAIRKAAPGLVRMADVCLCEYTDHGHCGVLADGDVENDATLPLLAKEAVAYARAGADVVAPSAMMDGQVARDPRGPRRRGLRADGDPRVLGEDRVGVLRPVPRRGGEHAGQGRPQGLPDGPRQPPRGDAGGAPRRRRGRRRRDGQARRAQPRPDPRRGRDRRRARSRRTR